MRSAGLIMAGGEGRRMSGSGLREPKPLVRVRGRSLLEHAVDWQVRSGLSEILVALRAGQDRVLSHVHRIQPQYANVRISPLVEEVALGNAGALLSLRTHFDQVLLSFADNVSTLSPSSLLKFHRNSGAEATLAVHETTVSFPFGVVALRTGRVVGYEEKPPVHRTIASGYAVFDLEPFRTIELSGPLGLADAIRVLLDLGHGVAAYEHQEAWVDVNHHDRIGMAAAVLAGVRSDEPVH